MNLIIPGGGSMVPAEVQDRLKQIDPALYIQPKQRTIFDSGAEGDRPQLQWVWYVVAKWPDNDPRWRMVKYGQTDPENAFDVLAQLPADCPLEQVPGYLTRQLKPSNGVARHLCDEVAKWNVDQSLRNGEATSEFAAELFEANKNTIFAAEGVVAPKPVAQYNPPRRGKNRPKEA